MKLDLVFKNSTSDKGFDQSFFENVLQNAIEELKLEGNIEVSVNLVTENKIKSLNQKYRGKETTTDVLSFPMNPVYHLRLGYT